MSKVHTMLKQIHVKNQRDAVKNLIKGKEKEYSSKIHEQRNNNNKKV